MDQVNSLGKENKEKNRKPMLEVRNSGERAKRGKIAVGPCEGTEQAQVEAHVDGAKQSYRV